LTGWQKRGESVPATEPCALARPTTFTSTTLRGSYRQQLISTRGSTATHRSEQYFVCRYSGSPLPYPSNFTGAGGGAGPGYPGTRDTTAVQSRSALPHLFSANTVYQFRPASSRFRLERWFRTNEADVVGIPESNNKPTQADLKPLSITGSTGVGDDPSPGYMTRNEQQLPVHKPAVAHSAGRHLLVGMSLAPTEHLHADGRRDSGASPTVHPKPCQFAGIGYGLAGFAARNVCLSRPSMFV